MIDFDATVLAAAEAAFAEQVTWYPPELPPAAANMIFFDAMQEIKFSEGSEVAEVVSMLSGRVADFARVPRQSDGFKVRGRWYVATEVLPDGVGSVAVRIRLATDQEAVRAQLPPVAAA